MASEKQVQANRRNAAKSTGPRSQDGKARAARNSVKHGLLSRDMLVSKEDPEELEAFREGMLAGLAPEGGLEGFLADLVVASGWRLRRAVQMERQIIEDRLSSEWKSRKREYRTREPEPTAEEMATDVLCHQDAFDKLVRYEAHVQRGFYKALHELQRVQAGREGRQAGAADEGGATTDYGLPTTDH